MTTASADIPVLARDLGAAIASSAELDLRRVETALSAGRTPEEQVKAVGRTILAQITAPVAGWIVIDDYQLLMVNRAAEDLIATLERSGRFRFMITSRDRPSWATSRGRVYLETAELAAADLALDDAEVAELLPPDRRTAALRRQARGWPAVLGLAAYSNASDVPLTADALSATLYDYFAEELFDSASHDVQRALTAFSVLSPLTVDELADFIGVREPAAQVVSSGLAYETDGRIEVHPLARDFLLAKLKDRPDVDAVARAAFASALRRSRYDQAFALLRQLDLDDCLERLITASYADLIRTGRIATLVEFGRYAATNSSLPHCFTDLITAEAALIGGEFDQASSSALAAVGAFQDGHALKARGLLIAGRAAYFAYRLEEALELHARASSHAISTSDANEAAWGKCVVAFALEDGQMPNAVRELASLASPRPVDRLRLATARRRLALLGGANGLRDDGSSASHTLAHVADPWVRSGWSHTWGYSLVLQARYQEARTVLRGTLVELGEFGFAFGTPHVEWSLAAAELGLRHFARCDALLRRIERHLSRNSDIHIQLNARALRARLLLALQRPKEALAITSVDYAKYPIRAMYAEYLSTRAVALAVVGARSEAIATAKEAETLNACLDATVLSAAARAMVAPDGSAEALEAAESLLESASTLAVWDPVICCVRASSPFLARLATIPSYQTELRDVVLRARDVTIAKAAGLVTRSTGQRGQLSPREREIMDHVRQGRRNAEIARSLFISTGTVKSHMDHIYRKARRAESHGGRNPLRRNRERRNRRVFRLVHRRLSRLGLILLPLERELRRSSHTIWLGRHRKNGLERSNDRRVELGVDRLREP